MKFKSGVIALAVLLGASGAHAQSGTFRQAHEVGFGAASDLDPISKGRVFLITEKVMSRLIRPSLDGKPSPDLAVSWTANATATEWVFKLREGVKFHNGKPFEAEDVLYSLGRVQDPKMDSPARATIKMVEKIEAVDKMTVKMTLASPFADLPLILTDYRLRIIPAGSGDTIKTTGIGTGPFKVEKFDAPGTSVLFANKEYWEGPPGVARMEIVGVPDAQARLQALLGGQLDMEAAISPQSRPLVERNSRLKLLQVQTGNWRGIALRTDLKPFDDVRVRRAIRLAVDRKGLLDLAVAGAGTIGCDTPVSPTDQYRSDKICAQDVAKAKALLAEAGYPNGLDMDLYVSTVEAVWPALAEAFQQQVAAAGVRVKINQVPSDGYWTQVWMKKEATMTRWGERPADAVLNEIYRGGATWNETFFKDAKLDGILDDARRELDFDKRRTKYLEAQDYLWENGGTVVAFHVNVLVGLSARVKGIDPVENNTIRWHQVKVD